MRFEGVIGQDAAVQALEAQLRRTGGAGSTLILGPEGVGRFLLAVRAASAILGEEARVAELQHPDLHVVLPDAGVRSLREDVLPALARRPLEGPRPVLIVRDADRMSVEAHNTLLKTLEEPPADAAILLVAEEAGFLPETVVSRCRIVRARPLTDEETARVLASRGLAGDAGDAEGSPGRAAYQAEAKSADDADALLAALEGRPGDPIGETERLARPRPGEERAEHRRRVQEALRVAATRLRRRLPATEAVLRSVVEALGSLSANANPAIVLAELALAPWKEPQKS